MSSQRVEAWASGLSSARAEEILVLACPDFLQLVVHPTLQISLGA
jgi:hypothetical protein